MKHKYIVILLFLSSNLHPNFNFVESTNSKVHKQQSVDIHLYGENIDYQNFTRDSKLIDKHSQFKQTQSIINGYKLPLKADIKINKSTLLGIDSNNNTIRDDVERWILQNNTNPCKKVDIELLFQLARVYSMILKNPDNAQKISKIMDNTLLCIAHFEHHYPLIDRNGNRNQIILSNNEKKFESLIFNTKERIAAYSRYNSNLSGGVYSMPLPNEWKGKCTFFNMEVLLNEYKENKSCSVKYTP